LLVKRIMTKDSACDTKDGGSVIWVLISAVCLTIFYPGRSYVKFFSKWIKYGVFALTVFVL
jgi:hypothetical protein